jgi:transposase
VPAAQTARLAAQKKTLIASEQDAQARAVWRELITELAADDLLFLDETSTQLVMTRPRARAPRGVRVLDRVPRNHGENVTCLAAISPRGVVAPLAFEGALDGPIFAQWVREWLVPELHAGQTVILDNLSVHKNAAARAAIEAVGCFVRFLPAYSPDFNPIELIFAKLKTALRGAAARTFAALIDALDAAFATITAADARACFRHCGYPLTPIENHSP